MLVLHDGGPVGGQAALLQIWEKVVEVDAVEKYTTNRWKRPVDFRFMTEPKDLKLPSQSIHQTSQHQLISFLRDFQTLLVRAQSPEMAEDASVVPQLGSERAGSIFITVQRLANGGVSFDFI